MPICCGGILVMFQPKSCFKVDPYHMITNRFSTLLCCQWAYGFTLTLLQFCAVGRGWILGNLGDGPAQVILYGHDG